MAIVSIINGEPDFTDEKVAFLMKPRYICIGDYPNNPFKVWEDYSHERRSGRDEPEIITPGIGKFEAYPADYFFPKRGHFRGFWSVFIGLRWNEMRQEHELPGYIKIKRFTNTREMPVVFRVIKPLEDWPAIGENTGNIIGGSMYEGRISGTNHQGIEYRSVEIQQYLPASEKEFLSQEYKDVPKSLQ
jgi:hypothetical protein